MYSIYPWKHLRTHHFASSQKICLVACTAKKASYAPASTNWKGKQFLSHCRPPSTFKCYKPGDKSCRSKRRYCDNENGIHPRLYVKVIRLIKSCWWPSKVRRTRWFDLFIKCSCVSSYHLWRKSRQEPQVLEWHLTSIRRQILFVCRHHYLVSHKKKTEIISNKLWLVGLGNGA